VIVKLRRFVHRHIRVHVYLLGRWFHFGPRWTIMQPGVERCC
jgi:hypothetical protein